MSRKKMNWLVGAGQLIFVVAVVGISMMLVGALGNMQDKRQPLTNKISEHKALSLSVVRPAMVTFTPEVDLNGVVEAQAVSGISAQVGGRVVTVSENFKPGSFAAKGDVLFRIDPADYELNVRAADAEIAAARSSLAQLKAEADLAIDEWKTLYPGQAIPDLAARVPQIAAASARLQSAQATREKAQLALSRTVVRAAENERILTTQLSVGQVVAANQSVGTAYPQNALEISAAISLDDLAVLSPVIGRGVEIRLDSLPNAVVQGRIIRQDAALDSRTRLATLYVQPDTTDGLSVGTFVQLKASGEPVSEAMTIPKTAYSRRGEVWVVSNGRLAPRSVIEIGETETHYVVRQFHVADGLVVAPPINAVEGQEVVIRGERD